MRRAVLGIPRQASGMIVYAVVIICLLVIGGYAYGMIFK